MVGKVQRKIMMFIIKLNKAYMMKEIPKQFFRVRLWDFAKIIEQLRLNDDLKAEISLKKVWLLNSEDKMECLKYRNY